MGDSHGACRAELDHAQWPTGQAAGRDGNDKEGYYTTQKDLSSLL